MNLEAGTIVHGRFKIDRAISSGGMGEVYRAFDAHKDNAPVALKRMLLDIADEDRDLIIRKFQEEVQVLQRLDYPGIPQFVADFMLDGSRCIVMEFIQGTDLESEVRERASLLQERGLPPAEAVKTVIQICKIVEYLHALRPHPIIHRDIKPANVIRRSQDGRVYLVDFGLARNVRESEAKQTKTMVGTVGYAPLEQFQGKPEQRSDQYSLAVTLHFLLTAESPIPFEIQPLEKLLPNIHPELAQIVRTATFREKDLRYQSVFDFRRELERVLPHLPDVVDRATQGTNPPPPDLSEGQTQRADWEQLLARNSQRQMIEGVHKEAKADDLDAFGTADPLAGQRHAEFNRAALQTLKQDDDDDEPPRRSRLAALAILLVGAGALLGAYIFMAGWLRPEWAQKLLDPPQRDAWKVRELAAVFETGERAGIGVTHPLPLGLLEWLRPPAQVGVVFERSQPVGVRKLLVRLEELAGDPELLFFAGDQGVLLKCQPGKYRAQAVTLAGGSLGSFRTASLVGEAYALKGPQLTLKLGQKVQARRLGVVLRNPSRNQDAVLANFKPE